MHFSNVLLDAVVDRFGTKYVQYAKVDEDHFSVTAKIEVSSAFYGWLLGFGDEAKLVYPEDAVYSFKEYLNKIQAMY
jgi:predicted DNA-binding transcriptional regulator YafY